MKISPVTLQNGTNFKAKKQNKRLKDTVPAAALALAVATNPINNDKVQAAQNKDAQIYPTYYPVIPVTPYYPSYATFYYYNTYVAPTILMMNYLQSMALLNTAYSNEPISIGNVAYNSQDIQSSGYYYDENDVKHHSVLLSNGTNITYKTQDENRMAMIYKDNNKYVFEGLEGAYIQGSANKDNYRLRGCQNTIVDIDDDDKSDKVFVTRYRSLPYGRKQYTENVRVDVEKGDIVNDVESNKDNVTLVYDGH